MTARRREKVFGAGPQRPLTCQEKVRIMRDAESLKRPTEPGRHYGVLTGKDCDVLHAMLWLVHDGESGQCNPSYATIAKKAGCSVSTVGSSIHRLEQVGILSWVNRLRRVEIRERDASGRWVTTTRVERTSNAYVFSRALPGRSLQRAARARVRGSNTKNRRGLLDIRKKISSTRVYAAPAKHQSALPLPPSPSERAAIVARMDTGTATKADWAVWLAALDARLHLTTGEHHALHSG